MSISLKKNHLAILFNLFILSVFSQNTKEFVVHGQIDTVPFAQYEVLYNDGFDSIIRDTLILDKHSKFKLQGLINEPTAVELSYYDGTIRNTVYMFWVEPNLKMNFHGRKYQGIQFKDYHLTNSKTDSLSKKYLILLKNNRETSEGDANVVTTEIIKENLDNYYPVRLLWDMVRGDNLDSAFVDHILSKLPLKLQHTNLAKNVRRKLDLVVGTVLPDVLQPDAEGNLISISDFRGKYLLVDFWASWCKPCRAENPSLVEVYKKYGNQQFEILGISLDDNRDKWLQAILDDGLPWKQVSDLKGFRGNKAGHELLVKGIPDNFLLDPEGRIIARALRGEQIEQFLKNILQNYIEKPEPVANDLRQTEGSSVKRPSQDVQE